MDFAVRARAPAWARTLCFWRTGAVLALLPSLAIAGPVPEFAPTQAVLLSRELFVADYHAPELAAAISSAGAEVWIANEDNATARAFEAASDGGARLPTAARILRLASAHLWLRDLAPQVVVRGDHTVAFVGMGGGDQESAPEGRFGREMARILAAPSEELPLAVDGGNFLTTGEICFTSATDLPQSMVNGRRLPSAQGGPNDLKVFGHRLGCRLVVVIKDPPHVHLDMWAKIVDANTVIVNELDAQSLAKVATADGQVPPEYLDLKAALDRGARQFGAYVRVRRLPMPVPYRGVFRTYTNAILVNGRALVPAFRNFGWSSREPFPDVDLAAKMEEKVASVYRSVGFQPQFINADHLIFNGGAWHCVSWSLPRLRQMVFSPKATKGK